MNLFENPFFLLDAGPETTRGELATRVEVFVSTASSPAMAARVRSVLHPRDRLGAEVAWLPGMDRREARRWLGRLRSRPSGFPGRSGEVHGLDGFNLALTALGLSGVPVSTAHLVRWIVVLGRTGTETDPDTVAGTIDETRAKAGFAPVDDVLDVAREIEARVDHGVDAVGRLLAAVPVTEAAEALAEALRTCAVIHGGTVGTFLSRLVAAHEERAAGPCRGLLEEALLLLAMGPTLPGDRSGEETWLSALDGRLRDWRRLAAPMIERGDLAGIPWPPLHEARGLLSGALARSRVGRVHPRLAARALALVERTLRSDVDTRVYA